MNFFKLMSTICFCLLILLTGCTYYKTVKYNYPISRDKAIMIAATNVPPDVIREASLSVVPPGRILEESTSNKMHDTYWAVYFDFAPDNSVSSISKSELGWSENAGDTFHHHGYLPQDRFCLLEIKIDPYTGNVISREASDGHIIGSIEPLPETDYVPLLLSIGSGILGLLIGALGVWLVLRRRRRIIGGASSL